MTRQEMVQRILADEPLPCNQQVDVVCVGCGWKGARYRGISHAIRAATVTRWCCTPTSCMP
jgi:YD repeat-containing protein